MSVSFTIVAPSLVRKFADCLEFAGATLAARKREIVRPSTKLSDLCDDEQRLLGLRLLRELPKDASPEFVKDLTAEAFALNERRNHDRKVSLRRKRQAQRIAHEEARIAAVLA